MKGRAQAIIYFFWIVFRVRGRNREAMNERHSAVRKGAVAVVQILTDPASLGGLLIDSVEPPVTGGGGGGGGDRHT